MPDDIKEHSKLALKAQVERGGLVGFLRAKKDLKATFKFAVTDGEADSTPAEVTKELKATTEETIDAGTVDIPRVKDGFEHYDLKVTIETVVDNQDARKRTMVRDYRVWPLDVTVNAVLADGKPAPEFKFKLLQSDKVIAPKLETAQAEVDGDAEYSQDLIFCGLIKIAAISPWVLDSREAPLKGRLWKVKVSKKPWTAKILSHPGGKTEKAFHKQYVNLPKDFGAGVGTVLKLEIGPEDLSHGSKDDEVKIRATFPATNCKRETPRPALWTGDDEGTALTSKVATAKPGVDELVYEAVLKLPADGGKAVCYLHMGVSGGDKCKVEVGVTDTYGDDVLHVQNFRKIGLELLVPDPTLRQKASDLLADTGAALSSLLLDELARLFKDTYIDFDFPVGRCVTLAEADYKRYLKGDGVSAFTTENVANPEHLFPTSAKFAYWKYEEGFFWSDWEKKTLPSGGGAKVALLSDYQRRTIREDKFGGTRPDHCMTWIFCDFIASRSKQNPSGPSPDFYQDMSLVFNTAVTAIEGPTAQKSVDVNFQVFDFDPILADGSLGVHKLRWRVQGFRRKGASSWSPVGATDPGGAYKDWQDVGPFTSVVERDKWVGLTNTITLDIKLPKDTPTSPGNLLSITKQEGPVTARVDVIYETKIQVEVSCYGVDFNALGGAVCGEGYIRTSGGVRSWQGTAKTVAHEIAHNLGQGYSPKEVGEVGGQTGAVIPGVPFGLKFPNGQYYVGHGHQGCHCAKQLVDVMKSASTSEKNAVNGGLFSSPSETHNKNYFSKLKDEKHCVMWGEGPESPTKTRNFCDACLEHLRATDVSDVNKLW
jgi:hypothetical protein